MQVKSTVLSPHHSFYSQAHFDAETGEASLLLSNVTVAAQGVLELAVENIFGLERKPIAVTIDGRKASVAEIGKC